MNINVKMRMISAFFIFIGIMMAIFYRFVDLQVLKRDEYVKMAKAQWLSDRETKGERGVIVDAEGKKLVTEKIVYEIAVDVTKITNKPQFIEKFITLGYLDELSLSKLIYENEDKKYIKLLPKVKEEEKDQIQNLALTGIIVKEIKERYYPFGRTAASVIGFTDADGRGVYGIERSYDAELTGKPGRTIKAVDAARNLLPLGEKKEIVAENGGEIVSTLNLELQQYAEKFLDEALVANKAHGVHAIVMNPTNGEVLAMASKPDFDLNDPKKIFYNPEKPWVKIEDEAQLEAINEMEWAQKKDIVYSNWRNTLVMDSYEPGSTFKIITAAAILEEGYYQDKKYFTQAPFYCDGYIKQVPGNVKCWSYKKPHGAQSLAQGLQNSCNEVFAQVGLELGAERFYRYLKAFGFGEATDIQLPGEQSGIIPKEAGIIKPIELVTMSFGQGFQATGIQMITAISATVNGGYLYEPSIVKRITKNGQVIFEHEPVLRRQVVSNETSRAICEMLESVVSKGTGKAAYIPGFKVGGKTGTAQKLYKGSYKDEKYISSFVAIGPGLSPQAVVLIIVDEPKGQNIYGGKIAAPVAKAILGKTLEILEISPEYTDQEMAGLQKSKVKLPQFVGLTVKEALKLAKENGIILQINGTDYQEEQSISAQFPGAGEEIFPQSAVEVYLE